MDCPISSFWITGQMAKRKRTDVVKLQLRIREGLRRRLEAAANAEERSLNSEIAHRLENSFEQDKNSLLLEVLLAPGAGLELIRAVALILRSAGRDWNTPPKSHAVSEAITKFIAVLSGERKPLVSFKNLSFEKGSADLFENSNDMLEHFDEFLRRQDERAGGQTANRPADLAPAGKTATVTGKPAGKMS
jgi:Arc-like DNA binding domain